MNDDRSADSAFAKLQRLPPALRNNLAILLIALVGVGLLVSNQVATQPAGTSAGTSWLERWRIWPWSSSATTVDKTADRFLDVSQKAAGASQRLLDRVIDEVDKRLPEADRADAPATSPADSTKR